jgi:hypothetical protein
VGDAVFPQACLALADVLPRLTEILRAQRDGSARAIGSWTLGDAAAHLSHVMERDTESVSGRPLPDIELNPAAVAGLTESMLSADTERNPGALADRLDALSKAFVALDPPDGLVTWIGGTRIPPSAVACHLLLETLVHGYDVATAAGVSWPIDRAHARLAIIGAAVPIIAASPQSWIRPERDPTASARVEIRLRGYERFTLDLDDTLSVEMPPKDRRPDVRLAADPAGLLLVMLGRMSSARLLLTGKVLAWGRRPTAVFTLLHNVSPP